MMPPTAQSTTKKYAENANTATMTTIVVARTRRALPKTPLRKDGD